MKTHSGQVRVKNNKSCSSFTENEHPNIIVSRLNGNENQEEIGGHYENGCLSSTQQPDQIRPFTSKATPNNLQSVVSSSERTECNFMMTQSQHEIQQQISETKQIFQKRGSLLAFLDPVPQSSSSITSSSALQDSEHQYNFQSLVSCKESGASSKET